MKLASYKQFFGKAMKYGCHELLGVKEDAIVIGNAHIKTSSYGRQIRFKNNEYYIMLNENVKPSFLLCLFIDIAAHRLQETEKFLAPPSGQPFLIRTWKPCTPEEWAEDVYVDLLNQLYLTYESSLGLKFELIDDLSAMLYEGDKFAGGLVFVENPAQEDDGVLSMCLQTNGDVLFERNKLKHICKLRAGAGDDYLLFRRNEKGQYVCMGYCEKERAKELGWNISFRDILDWEFYYKDAPLFRVLHYRPRVVQDPIDMVLEKLNREFGGLNEKKAREFLESAQSQKHGTSLIFADFNDSTIKEWLERLYRYKKAVQIELNSTTDAEAIERLSRMDGALFVDVNKMVLEYAAVIVDGRTMVEGRLDRGARHNGIQTFLSDLVSVDKKKHRIAAVIFSEDGGAVTLCGQDCLDNVRKYHKNIKKPLDKPPPCVI